MRHFSTAATRSIALSTLVLLAGAQPAQAQTAPKKYKIALILGTTTDNFYTSMQCGAVEAARRLGDVELTVHEFNLLYVLLSHPGIVFTRDALLRRTWKENTFVTVRSVDTLVKRLRRKIEEDPANPTVISTVWGAGYKAADV